MWDIRRQLMRKKLLIFILATWLASSGYVIQQHVASWGYHQRAKEQQPLPLSDATPARNSSSYTPPNWPKLSDEDRRQLSSVMMNSDAYIQILSSKTNRRGDYFDMRINATNMKRLADLMWQVDDFCRQHNLVYFMYGATLIGSHRHHGIIPWDDDIDIMVPKSERNRFLYLLRTQAHHLRIYTWSYHWKIWSPATSVNIISRNYGWPFIDIFFYAENETHIYDTEIYYTNTYTYEKSLVFPLHYRPFMGRWLPAPRDTSKFLVVTVKDPEGCHSPYYLHKEEKAPKKAVGTRCEMLRHRYPFTTKNIPPPGHGDGILETLFLGDIPLYTVLVAEPAASITFNYSLRLINSDGVRYAEPYS